MPRRLNLRPIKSTGRKAGWKVDVPGRFTTSGKRQRLFFATKAEGENFVETEKIRIENYGSSGGAMLPPAQRDEAAKAFEDLKSYNVSLTTVVHDWITRHEARKETVEFAIGAEKYQAWLKKRLIRGRPVSDSYKATTKQTFARFSCFDDVRLSEIDARMIAAGCEKMTPTVKNTALAVLSAFFTWCMQTPRHWVATNPAKIVPRESTGGKEVQTFSADEVSRIMAACDSSDLVAYHALGLFAGIRPEELERTEWKFINLDENVIVLPATNDAGKRVTKTGKRRVIEMTNTLVAWLQWLIAKDGIQQGPIISTVNLRRRLRALREVAKVAWIQDGMRHTYASNWLAIHKDEHRLRDNLGHKSASELWDHYHKATTAKEAGEFEKVLPPSSRKVVPFKREARA